MTTPTDCPFCRTNNLLKVKIIAETATAYLLPAMGSDDCHLIVPVSHIESPLDLSDTWWQDVKHLLAKVPGLPDDFNLSFNIGKLAGQTVKHLHLWVIPRYDGQPATGHGLATLINDANQE